MNQPPQQKNRLKTSHITPKRTSAPHNDHNPHHNPQDQHQQHALEPQTPQKTTITHQRLDTIEPSQTATDEPAPHPPDEAYTKPKKPT
jgi:hypothetical protein